MNPRLRELLDRMVAPGQFPNMSASEGHELVALVEDLQGEQPKSPDMLIWQPADKDDVPTRGNFLALHGIHGEWHGWHVCGTMTVAQNIECGPYIQFLKRR